MAALRLGLWLTALMALLGPLLAPAAAHEARPIYIELTETAPQTYSMRWKIPPVMPTRDLPSITLSGCTLQAGTEGKALIGQANYLCAAKPSQIILDFPGANPVLSTLVRTAALDGFEESRITGPEETLVPVPTKQSFWEVASGYSFNGVDHILEGYDHLLFVLCLMLLAGSLKRILITVTGFTLGHSITLGMSALAGWSLPPSFVEPLIAFSILMLAVEVTKGKTDTLAYRFPALIATGFGLLHGFGFGGALAEIGLPQGMHIQALAFFNIGVEIGQVLFVLVAYAFYQITRRASQIVKTQTRPEALKPLVMYPAGFIAAYWTIERVSGVWA